MDMEDYNREIREAIQAGKKARNALKNAAEALKSAGNLGILDMIGGGFLISSAKHSRLDEARDYMGMAQYELQNFSRELRDVQMNGKYQLEFDGMTRFLDVFCDNIFTDVLVQSRIREAQSQVAEAGREVQNIINNLERLIEPV